jgi:hypothetical protein
MEIKKHRSASSLRTRLRQASCGQSHWRLPFGKAQDKIRILTVASLVESMAEYECMKRSRIICGLRGI